MKTVVEAVSEAERIAGDPSATPEDVERALELVDAYGDDFASECIRHTLGAMQVKEEGVLP